MTPVTPQQIDAFLAVFPTTKRDELMSKHTSFRIGGPARLYVVVSTPEEAIKAVETAESLKLPWYVFGGGSNLLVNDAGYEGVLIQVADRRIVIQGDAIICGNGAITAMVARQSVDAGLTGFEWAVGVPGTIGGAIYGNAGCYGGEMKDVLVSVDAYRLSDKQRVTYLANECSYGYRESRFKSEPHLIFGGVIKLTPTTDVAAGKLKMENIMKQRREKQPLESSSAGCVFKNFEYHSDDQIELLKRAVEVPVTMLEKKTISCGWLVDQVGMMGQSVGDLEVSTKHGNFFVNKGKGRAEDVLALISRVKMKVRDELGIEMQEEVQYVGF